METKIEQLQEELFGVLKKAEKDKQKISIFRILCYGGALLYFFGIIAMQIVIYSGGDTSFLYTLNPHPTFWEQYKMLILILPLIVLITIGGYGLAVYHKKFTEAEHRSIRRIIGAMFPDATCSPVPHYPAKSLIQQSNFWANTDIENINRQSFGTITFENNNRKLTFYDLLINAGSQQNRLAKSSVGAFVFIAAVLFKGLFAKRVENITATFRGMFTFAQLEKKINGSVVVLPDHLESHLDYLAKNIQLLKNVNGNKLVILEDMEFERFFAVYASDENTARYILTPAIMFRITELRKKYNRDIMLSFNEDKFFFAVAMPEGFMTLGDASFTSGEALRDLYDNLVTARDTFNDLKIK